MRVLLFIFLIFSAAFAFADSPQTRFEEANRLFSEGKYDKAVDIYEQIRKNDGVSAPLLFNLANAQYRNHQTAEAVLNLERARFLKPNDPDIAANLRLARSASGLREEEWPWWKKQAYEFSSDAWAFLTFVCGFICTSFFIVLAVAKPGRADNVFKAACGALSLLALAGILGFAGRADQFNDAIVMSGNATARISPFASAEMAFPLPQGEKVSVRKEHNDFVLVSNTAGKTGWVLADQIEKIVP